jgi:hypothetical protein
MTGSVALDVVIGLVFIYSLYSLLTTTITEMIASIIRLRASFLAKGIKRMLDDGSKTKVFSDAFFKQPLIKYLASGSLFGVVNKPSYLSAQNFSKALLEVLKNNGSEILKKANETETTALAKIHEAVRDLPVTINPLAKSETIGFIRTLLEDAQNDIDKFKASLEQWYDDTMERVTSWYKKWVQLITFIIGFIVAAVFNVDSIDIVKKLSHDPKVREQYVALAQKFAENKDAFRQLSNDTTTTKNYDTLSQVLSSLKKQAKEGNEVLSINGYNSTTIWGWLLTAIALSLGAPFFFDLLNKLMKLRSSVQAGEQTKSKTKTT